MQRKIWLTWYCLNPQLFNFKTPTTSNNFIFTKKNNIKFTNLFRTLPAKIFDSENQVRNSYKYYFPITVYISKRLKLKHHISKLQIDSSRLFISIWNTGLIVIRLHIESKNDIKKDSRWLQERWTYLGEEITLLEISKEIISDFIGTVTEKIKGSDFRLNTQPDVYFLKYDFKDDDYEKQIQQLKQNIPSSNENLRSSYQLVNINYSGEIQLFINASKGKMIIKQGIQDKLPNQVREGLFYLLDYFHNNFFWLQNLKHNFKTTIEPSQSSELVNFIAINLHPFFIAKPNYGLFSINPYTSLLQLLIEKIDLLKYYNEFETYFVTIFNQLPEAIKQLFYQNSLNFQNGLILEFLSKQTKHDSLEGYKDIKDKPMLFFSFAVVVESYLDAVNDRNENVTDDFERKKQVSMNKIVTRSKELSKLHKNELPYPYKNLNCKISFSSEKIYKEMPLDTLFYRNILKMIPKSRGRPRTHSKVGNVQYTLSSEWQEIEKIYSFFGRP